MPIQYLKLRLFVRQIVHALQYLYLEHQNVIIGWSTGVTLAFLAKRLVDYRLESVPIDGCIQLFQRVAHRAQLCKLVFNIKQTDLAHFLFSRQGALQVSG